MTQEDVETYTKNIKNVNVIDFNFSGHMIVDEEIGKYRQVVSNFLLDLDTKQ